MNKLIRMTVTTLCILAPLTAFGQTSAIVVMTDDAGIGEATARTVRQIVADELRTYKVDVLDRPGLDRLVPLGLEVKEIAKAAGVQKIYAVSLSALGQKILVRVEELTADLQPLQHRRLTSRGPEELDKIIPRVVKAMMTGQSIEESAEVDTVTETEGKKWEKKPGEFMWGGGVMLGGGLASDAHVAYGFDLRSGYEMKHFRLNAVTGFMFNVDRAFEAEGMFHGGVGASYIPSSSDWSPYFGGGLSYMILGVAGKEGNGIAANVHVGFEAFRLHRARMLVEFGCMIPFFNLEEGGEEIYTVELYGLLAVMM